MSADIQSPEQDLPSPRPWALVLEVVHLDGPPFDLDRHGERIETAIFELFANCVVHLGGGTKVRVETYMHRTADMPLLDPEAQS